MRSARYQILTVAVVVIATVSFGQVSIDRARSKLIVHTFKSGLFSAFAHNLEVEAPIAEGTVDEVAQRVNLVIDSRNMKVLDPQLSADKRGKLQERILTPQSWIRNATRRSRLSPREFNRLGKDSSS
jgi:hypothetical protein